jgi:hypothetical protein
MSVPKMAAGAEQGRESFKMPRPASEVLADKVAARQAAEATATPAEPVVAAAEAPESAPVVAEPEAPPVAESEPVAAPVAEPAPVAARGAEFSEALVALKKAGEEKAQLAAEIAQLKAEREAVGKAPLSPEISAKMAELTASAAELKKLKSKLELAKKYPSTVPDLVGVPFEQIGKALAAGGIDPAAVEALRQQEESENRVNAALAELKAKQEALDAEKAAKDLDDARRLVIATTQDIIAKGGLSTEFCRIKGARATEDAFGHIQAFCRQTGRIPDATEIGRMVVEIETVYEKEYAAAASTEKWKARGAAAPAPAVKAPVAPAKTTPVAAKTVAPAPAPAATVTGPKVKMLGNGELAKKPSLTVDRVRARLGGRFSWEEEATKH